MNSRLYSKMKLLKDSKFHFLRNEFSSIRDSTPTHENLPDKKIVVTIPADLELTEVETSVLSKGLTFVPVNNKVDEYQVKADCEKYFHRLRLKAHFHGQADTLTDSAAPAETDHFARFDAKVSTWTPPDGQFTAVDHYIDLGLGLTLFLTSIQHFNSHQLLPKRNYHFSISTCAFLKIEFKPLPSTRKQILTTTSISLLFILITASVLYLTASSSAFVDFAQTMMTS